MRDGYAAVMAKLDEFPASAAQARVRPRKKGPPDWLSG